MMEINIWLFGKPEWMIDIEAASAAEFSALGEGIKKQLEMVASLIPKLESAGWERSGGLYDIFFHKEISPKDAKQELESLGVSWKDICLHYWKEEEDFTCLSGCCQTRSKT